jgi:hypothetical protein
MKQYLKRDGSIHERLPRLDDYIEDEENTSVSKAFAVEVLDEDLEMIATELMDGETYPAESVLKWCLLKHRRAGTVYASVRRLYRLKY